MKKIEIKISDDKLFTDVCLVVDQEKFLKLIEQARDKLHIKDLLTLEEYRDFSRKNIYGSPKNEFNEIVEDIRRKLKLPVTYLAVIRKSILCGEIQESDYKLAYLELKNGDWNEEEDFLDITPTIIFSPHARKDDIIRAWQDYNDEIGKHKGVENYKYIPKEVHTEKGKSAIKDHRSWWLLKNQGKDTNDILDIINDEQPSNIDESTIRKGIDNYEKLLRKSRVS